MQIDKKIQKPTKIADIGIGEDDEDNRMLFLRISINDQELVSSVMPINRNPTFLSHMRASVSFIFRFYALRALESAPFVRFGPSSFEAT